ncbi:MAG: molybdopterin molybdotransferase MoeA [Ostreibacterium sp.]
MNTNINMSANNGVSFCDIDADAISIEQAHHLILQTAKTVLETEMVTIRAALGRVLRRDAVSLVDNPPNDNSAMDGYGVCIADCENDGATLTVIGKSFAGNPFDGEVGRGEAIRIMTGAKIPVGVDAVVMQEQTDFDEVTQTVTLKTAVKKGQNIRLQGEDITVGQTVITAGTCLSPACIGVLATMGLSEVEVSRKINVAVLSTGDELQSVGTTLKAGNIYDSNRYALQALLNNPRFNIIEKGVLNDKRETLEKSFLDIANYVDMVITTGGVSVGEADWVKDCIRRVGKLIFWKVSIKPGRPVTFGSVGNALFFGLPGNPVSVMVTFAKLTEVALQKLAGQRIEQPLRLEARLTSPIKKRRGRSEFQRAMMSYNEVGKLCVTVTGDQGSGILSSMVEGNCLVVLGSDEGSKAVGEVVRVEPFSAYI